MTRLKRRRRKGEIRASGPADGRGRSRHTRVNVAVEAGIRQGWDEIIGSTGIFVGMAGFGAGAPCRELYQHFGVMAEKVAEAAFAGLRKS
jgi:transketolase